MESRVIAGLVGGDMNAIGRSEHEFHKANDVDIKERLGGRSCSAGASLEAFLEKHFVWPSQREYMGLPVEW